MLEGSGSNSRELDAEVVFAGTDGKGATVVPVVGDNPSSMLLVLERVGDSAIIESASGSCAGLASERPACSREAFEPRIGLWSDD